jgi:transposase
VLPGWEKKSARSLGGQNGPMAGRPSKLTEERADDLVVLLAARVPVAVAARSVNVSRRTLDRWLRRSDLRARVEQARAAGPESTDAMTEARAVVLILRAAQTDWRASAWWLERRWPERWGPRPA